MSVNLEKLRGKEVEVYDIQGHRTAKGILETYNTEDGSVVIAGAYLPIVVNWNQVLKIEPSFRAYEQEAKERKAEST